MESNFEIFQLLFPDLWKQLCRVCVNESFLVYACIQIQ